MLYEKYWSNRADERLSEADFAAKWPKLQRHIPRDAGVNIVDFGCGNGELLKEMLAINPRAEYTGLDVSATALTAAAASLPQMKFHQIADGGEFPVQSESIDFVFSSEVIEHVYDTENAFSEIARILRPGGRLLMTTPYHGLVKNILLVFAAFDSHFDPTGAHVRFFSKKSLFACLTRVELEPVASEYYGRVFPISNSIVVLAEKRG